MCYEKSGYHRVPYPLNTECAISRQQIAQSSTGPAGNTPNLHLPLQEQLKALVLHCLLKAQGETGLDSTVATSRRGQTPSLFQHQEQGTATSAVLNHQRNLTDGEMYIDTRFPK